MENTPLKGCSMSNSALIPDEIGFDLFHDIEVIHNKSEEMKEVTDQLAHPLYRGFIGQCGLNSSDVEDFQNGAEQLHEFSHNLFDGARAFETEILSCSTMNPIYSSLMHDGKIVTLYFEFLSNCNSLSSFPCVIVSILFRRSTGWDHMDIFYNTFCSSIFYGKFHLNTLLQECKQLFFIIVLV
jgi:hypothetical protein